MDYPKISIITPSFNQGDFIESTIKSVIDQGYPNLEYIVMDGLSKDKTVSILKKFSSQLTWYSEPDDGQADAINKGINRSSGEILGIINSDDYYLPGSLLSVANAFINKPDCMWVTGDYVIVNQHNQPIQSFVVLYKRFLSKFSHINVFKVANYINQPSTFWKGSVHSELGLFDTSLNYVFDYDFLMRLFLRYSPCHLNKPLSAFRIHPASKGGGQFEMQFAEELEVLKRYKCSKIVYQLHNLHNRVITSIYRLIK
jgi:glycosyltransferase involved in cell wall biosynthesis